MLFPCNSAKGDLCRIYFQTESDFRKDSLKLTDARNIQLKLELFIPRPTLEYFESSYFPHSAFSAFAIFLRNLATKILLAPFIFGDDDFSQS